MSARPEAHTARFLAWLYSTDSQQPVLGALCGIEREIGASLEPGLDHHVAHTRLQWWREELGRCAAGNPVHPLTRELRVRLQEAAPGGKVDCAGLQGFVDAATWDLADATFEQREELTAYCRRWAAAMVVPVSSAAGTGAPGVDWTEIGAALCELELLGRLAEDARRGRVRVPLDELEQAAVAPESIAAPPWPRELADLLAGRHRALRRQLAVAIDGLLPDAQRSCRGLLVWAALAWQASVRAERALPLPAATSIARAAAANWRAWRAARAAGAGRLRLR
ncbi:MAG: squalene/phytoene synthase family protein [Steroidobacteraceae bacterium]